MSTGVSQIKLKPKTENERIAEKWYRPHPLSYTFRQKYLNNVIIVKGKKQTVLETNRIELRYFKDENNEKRRGYAYAVNQISDIGWDTSWNQDDTAQECYIAFYEGYQIIKAVLRAALDFLAVGKVEKRDKDRRQYPKWSTYQEDVRHEKAVAKILGYNVDVWLVYWRKDFLLRRDRRWYIAPVENAEQSNAIQEYRRRLYRRANPPIVVGGSWEYHFELKDCRKYAGSANPASGGKGERIDLIKELRQRKDGTLEIVEFPRPGSEVVPWRLNVVQRESIKPLEYHEEVAEPKYENEEEALIEQGDIDAIRTKADNEWLALEDGFDFEQIGLEQGDYQGISSDDI